MVAELTARNAGNKAGSGFAAGATNEALIGRIDKITKITKITKGNSTVGQWLSAIVSEKILKQGNHKKIYL